MATKQRVFTPIAVFSSNLKLFFQNVNEKDLQKYRLLKKQEQTGT